MDSLGEDGEDNNQSKSRPWISFGEEKIDHEMEDYRLWQNRRRVSQTEENMLFWFNLFHIRILNLKTISDDIAFPIGMSSH